MELKDRVEGLLKDHQIYHDDVQIARFIVAPTERTAFGAYQQCLRELYRRYRGLKELCIARARLRLRISGYQRWGWVPWGRQQRRLALHEALLAREDLERNLEDTAREFRAFLQRAEELKTRVGSLTGKRRRELELQQWEHKLAVQARFDLLTTGRLARQTLETIAAMPESSLARIADQAGLNMDKLSTLPRPVADATVPTAQDGPTVSIAALDVDGLVAGSNEV
jgi:hypothetical protein